MPSLSAAGLFSFQEATMDYGAFLQNRGLHFHRTAVKLGDGVICTTTFGAIGLTTHVWGLAQGRLEQKLVEDIGGYGVMQGHCEIEPLVEFLWQANKWDVLRIVVQYVKDHQGRTFICVQRGAHAWYAIARTNRPDDPMLLKEFFSTRRAHDKQGFGFCASKGAPTRIYNYRPDILDSQTIVNMYGWWLRWAERLIGGRALHHGAWQGEVKHGIGKRANDVSSLRRSVEARIVRRPLTKPAAVGKGGEASPTSQDDTPAGKDQLPKGLSFNEALQWYRDGWERLAEVRLKWLKKEGKLEEALDLLEKLIVVLGDKPESLADCYMHKGVINEKLGEFEEAARAYRRALVLEPKDRAAWYFSHNNLGFCLNQLNFYGEAEPYLRQAIAIQPAWHNAYKNLGISLAAQGEYGEAAKLFVQATVICPTDPRALGHLEELLEEHELIYVQVPEILADLEKCRTLVERKGPGREVVRRISPRAMAEKAGSRPEEGQLKAKTIAILDDEPIFLEVLGTELAGQGYEVLTCTDKSAFLEELPTLSVDLVISDIYSPRMNGLEFLKAMKRDEKGRTIPVIIISGSLGPEAVNAKFQGAYATFSKPPKIEEVLVAVKRALSKERRDLDLFEGQAG